MEKNIYKLLVLFISLFLTSLISSAQEKRCITEIYSVEKSQSKSYARELEVYLLNTKESTAAGIIERKDSIGNYAKVKKLNEAILQFNKENQEKIADREY